MADDEYQTIGVASRFGSRIRNALVFSLVCCNSQGPTAAHTPDQRAGIRERIQPGCRQRQNGTAVFTHVTRVPAGGLRSPTGTEAREVRQVDGPGRMGAYFGIRLEQTHSPSHGTHS